MCTRSVPLTPVLWGGKSASYWRVISQLRRPGPLVNPGGPATREALTPSHVQGSPRWPPAPLQTAAQLPWQQPGPTCISPASCTPGCGRPGGKWGGVRPPQGQGLLASIQGKPVSAPPPRSAPPSRVQSWGGHRPLACPRDPGAPGRMHFPLRRLSPSMSIDRHQQGPAAGGSPRALPTGSSSPQAPRPPLPPHEPPGSLLLARSPSAPRLPICSIFVSFQHEE